MSAARVIAQVENKQAPVQPSQVEAHVNVNFVKESIAKVGISDGFHGCFYTGQDRVTLQNHQIHRVRELQEINDNLQRDIIKKERELTNASDPLAILADMEHCNIMIARNTGEIIKIYTQNDERLKRIAELESENARLKDELIDMRDKFIHTHDMQQRTKFAVDFFLIKSKLEKNTSELYDLKQS